MMVRSDRGRCWRDFSNKIETCHRRVKCVSVVVSSERRIDPFLHQAVLPWSIYVFLLSSPIATMYLIQLRCASPWC